MVRKGIRSAVSKPPSPFLLRLFPPIKKGLCRNESSFLHSPFLLCFHLVQGSGFKVQGSRFRVQGSRFRVQGSGFRVQGSGLRWRLRRLFLEDGILVSQPSPLGNTIKLSGRTFLAPHRGSSPMGLCKRTGFLGVKRRENPVRCHFERSEMRGLRSGIA